MKCHTGSDVAAALVVEVAWASVSGVALRPGLISDAAEGVCRGADTTPEALERRRRGPTRSLFTRVFPILLA